MPAEGRGEPVYLRPLERDDAERIYGWHNDATLYESLIGPFRPVSSAVVRAWLERKQTFSLEEINWAICAKGSSEHVGNLYLRDIDLISRHAELSVFIGDRANRSRGYGSGAVRLALDYAFQDLGLARVYLFVLASNRRAAELYEKCGFVHEGTLRKHALKGGTLTDVYIMGICAGDPSLHRGS